jgi:signal transduction histidine kinase
MDVTTDSQLQEARLRYLSEASLLLASSLDYETTFKNITRLVVPHLADWCSIWITDISEVLDDHTNEAATLPKALMRHLEVAHTDPHQESLIRKFSRELVNDFDENHPRMKAFYTRQSQLIPIVPPELIDQLISDPEVRTLLKEIKLKSSMYVPFVSRGQVLGVIALASSWDGSGRQFDQEDLELAEELARRAASAIDNALLYKAEQQARQAIERLQAVTVALSEAVTPSQVTTVILEQGIAALGATNGFVCMFDQSRNELEVVGAVGYPTAVIKDWQRYSIALPTPASEVVNNGEPLWLENLEDEAVEKRYPQLVAELRANEIKGASIVMPLKIKGEITGVFGLGFNTRQNFDSKTKGFVAALSQQCAQALERARLYEAEQQARQYSAFLAEASLALSSSLDYEATLQKIAELAVPTLGDSCTVDIVGADGQIQRLGVASRATPHLQSLVQKLLKYSPQQESHPVVQAIRTGQAQVNYDMGGEYITAAIQDEEHSRIIEQLAPRSIMAIPMRVKGQVLGAINFAVFTVSGRRYSAADVVRAEEFVNRVSLALDNARLYREAQRAIKDREVFISVAAHELKTPVTGLKGFAQLLGRQLANKTKGIDPERLERAAQNIMGQADKLTRLINQLLEVSRLESGKLELEVKPTDLKKLLEEVVNLVQAGTTNHSLNLTAPLEPVVARVDPLRIEQVVTNLLNNALKYSPVGGPVEIELGLVNTDPQSICIAVQDWGLGVPVERREGLFERFYQAHTQGYLGGMGLGLYISREIVELHGGRIEAQFPEEGGSRFVITLPYLAPENLVSASPF